MGGQSLLLEDNALHLDLPTALNKLVWLKAEDYAVRVQAGMSWRDLQEQLQPHGLVVLTMQSFSNFSIGGSVSVNAHGRYMGHGTVGNSVRALQLVLADGRVVEASRQVNPELFAAALGGYGLIGVITEVELTLARNVRLKRSVKEVGLSEYDAHYRQGLLTDSANQLHNADLLPPHFNRPYGITWRLSDEALTDDTQLTPRHLDYSMQRRVTWLLTEVPGASGLRRSVLNPLMHRKPVVKLLSAEASRDLYELSHRGSSRHQRGLKTQFALQELFVPVSAFEPFTRALIPLLQLSYPKTLNVSIRHCPADSVSALPYAKDEVYCLAVYYKQDPEDRRTDVAQWVQSLLELTLAHGGRFYLPYELHATREQFERAYPEVVRLREHKALVDPEHKFMNGLWMKYL